MAALSAGAIPTAGVPWMMLGFGVLVLVTALEASPRLGGWLLLLLVLAMLYQASARGIL